MGTNNLVGKLSKNEKIVYEQFIANVYDSVLYVRNVEFDLRKTL